VGAPSDPKGLWIVPSVHWCSSRRQDDVTISTAFYNKVASPATPVRRRYGSPKGAAVGFADSSLSKVAPPPVPVS